MAEAIEGLASEPPRDHETPDWESAGRVHEWKNYASDDLRKTWPEFSARHRAIISASLQDAADQEEWD